MKTTATTFVKQQAPTDFRLFLQAELARRCAANPQYSLRAFALHLGINHSTLSQLLRAKRPLTVRTIEKLGKSLGLEPAEIEAFITHEKLIVPVNRGISLGIQQLTLDSVALLSDPCHRSIMELLKVEDFIPDIRWIARVLNASIDEITIAVTRLLRLGLLEMSEHDGWLDKSGAADGDENHFASRVIQKLSERVSSFQNNERTETSVNAQNLPAYKLTIKSTDLPTVVETIKRLQKALAKHIVQDEEHEQTYQLEINIFPTNNQTKE